MSISFKTVEEFNVERAHLILDNWDEMPSELKDGTHHVGDANLKRIFSNYINKSTIIKGTNRATIPVTYHYSKFMKNSGRQYAIGHLSLQSLTRKIRHTITHDIYNDIDIKNAHLTILAQYCEKRGWNCGAIKKSVINNEKYLKEMMELDNLTRDEAKKRKLQVSYGSLKVSSKAPWFEKFKKNIIRIHEHMMKADENKELIETIKIEKKSDKVDYYGRPYDVYNVNGKLCGQLMCMIENKLLEACIEYLKREHIPIKNIVLCFDGFMIKKEIFNPSTEILEKMSEYVYDKTGYKVTYVSKPQDEIVSLEGLKRTISEDIIIDNDVTACDLLLAKMKGTIYSCDNNIYVKTSDTNIWTNDEMIVERQIANSLIDMPLVVEKSSGKYASYSKNLNGIRNLLALVKYRSPIDNSLVETIRLKSKGKIFFKNGVYDFSIGKLRTETDDDMTPIRIDKNYNGNVDKSAKKELINILNGIFDNEKQTINMLQHGARGIAGNIEDKDFVIGVGLRDCGKGILTQLFATSFGVYASEVDANNFLGSKRIGKTDEAKNKMWLIRNMWTRILLANECDIDNGNEKSIINGVLIKSLMSGGDMQTARSLYKTEIKFVFNGRLFMFINDLPEIKPVDTCQHMALFQFPHKFIPPQRYEELKKKNELQPFERIEHVEYKDKLKNIKYTDAFIQLIFENYKNEPVINCDDITRDSKEFRKDAGDELLYYKETFDYTDKKTFTPLEEIYDKVNEKYPDVSAQKIKTFLTKNMKLIEGRKRIDGIQLRGYFGIKIKDSEDIDL